MYIYFLNNLNLNKKLKGGIVQSKKIMSRILIKFKAY